MIDNYLLEELVAFKKYGTLAAAADQLGLYKFNHSSKDRKSD